VSQETYKATHGTNPNRTESDNADVELRVLQDFARRGPLSIDPDTCEKRLPPEPDTVCTVRGEGPVAFELVEIRDADLARLMAQVAGAQGVYLRTSDPSHAVVAKKLRKTYVTTSPAELLCYSGRALSPDAFIIETLRPLLLSDSFQYRRVWLLGHKAIHQVWPETGSPAPSLSGLSFA
jgi:hypothetical protein